MGLDGREEGLVRSWGVILNEDSQCTDQDGLSTDPFQANQVFCA